MKVAQDWSKRNIPPSALTSTSLSFEQEEELLRVAVAAFGVPEQLRSLIRARDGALFLLSSLSVRFFLTVE
jgi:hypothetical protein